MDKLARRCRKVAPGNTKFQRSCKNRHQLLFMQRLDIVFSVVHKSPRSLSSSKHYQRVKLSATKTNSFLLDPSQMTMVLSEQPVVLPKRPFHGLQRTKIIMKSDNHITRLFIHYCHEVCLHAGIDHVRNFIQQAHCIFRMRTTPRSKSFTCFKCRCFCGQKLQRYMSSLPSCVFPDADNNHYPFRTLAIDFIGPFEVVEKRYVCAFTCRVSRAVHFEVADSLSQD